MSKLKPLDLDNEVKIPDNELAQSCFEMILRALVSDEKEFDTKEEALDCIFSLLSEFKDEIKQRIKSACEFYLKYKDNPELFSKEQYKIKWERYRDIGCLVWVKKMWINYNEWLFKLAFKEVLKNEE